MPAATATDQKIVQEILIKTGVDPEMATKLRPERAITKLVHRIQKNGVPDGLSDKQREVLQGVMTDSSGNGDTSTIEETEEDPADPSEEVLEAGGYEIEDKPVKKSKKNKKSKTAASAAAPDKSEKTAKASAKDVNVTPKEPKKRGKNGLDVVRELFPNRGDTCDPDKFIKAVMAAGKSEATARTYLADGKKNSDLLGFLLIQKERGGTISRK